jgi:hypothetical protein
MSREFYLMTVQTVNAMMTMLLEPFTILVPISIISMMCCISDNGKSFYPMVAILDVGSTGRLEYA